MRSVWFDRDKDFFKIRREGETERRIMEKKDLNKR